MPEWLNIARVVDSEDLPLNISRKTPQDRRLSACPRRPIRGFCKDLIMPEWLHIAGVVDSEDLPLNIYHKTSHQNMSPPSPRACGCLQARLPAETTPSMNRQHPLRKGAPSGKKRSLIITIRTSSCEVVQRAHTGGWKGCRKQSYALGTALCEGSIHWPVHPWPHQLPPSPHPPTSLLRRVAILDQGLHAVRPVPPESCAIGWHWSPAPSPLYPAITYPPPPQSPPKNRKPYRIHVPENKKHGRSSGLTRANLHTMLHMYRLSQ